MGGRGGEHCIGGSGGGDGLGRPIHGVANGLLCCFWKQRISGECGLFFII